MGRWAAASRPRSWRLRRSASASIAGHAQSPAEFYKGKQRRALHRLQRRRRLRSLCARARAPHRQAHPGQSDHRRRRTWRAPAACGSPTGSTMSGAKDGTVIGTIGRGTGVRSAARLQGRAVPGRQVHLDRQRQQRGQHLRRLEGQRHHKVRGRAQQGADRRRHRRGGRHRSVPAHPQRRARHQVQDRRPAIRAATTSRWRWSAAR